MSGSRSLVLILLLSLVGFAAASREWELYEIIVDVTAHVVFGQIVRLQLATDIVKGGRASPFIEIVDCCIESRLKHHI
jgi:hypothetical protein